ncbi:LRR receptor-like serine/threonine-protein kinase GSO1 [Musa acuminata AAA Group]|uniref:LRR receptor-like serine/threonine-protein kinase GSO1 n=1 Tax=Musa acuminata AAA Group TaxID=214697 RepID=UPI0031DA1DC3
MARLDLSKNYNIMATMLRWLSNATSLEYLDLSGCGSLTVEPPQVALGALINLKGLDLSSNSLEGDILGILSNVSGGGLKHLDLSQNYFTGTITRIVRSLRHLQHLDLSDNSNVAGHVPDLLGNLTSLRHLSLRDNNLIDGEIPPTMGHFVRLEHLDLSHTRITGDVPSSIGNLSDLVYLDLAGCSITGQIPPSVGNLTEREYLDLSSNDVVGSIPETIGSMVHLETLNLFDNSVAGQLPETMGRLRRLKSLDIADNKLSGQLPTAMGDLCNLTLLDLSYNNIAGDLTDLLRGLSTCSRGSSLLSLFMKDNNLSGIIPSSMGQLSQLEYLFLSSNSLVGNITEAHFSNLTKLFEFTIVSNSLNVILPNDWLPPFSVFFIDMSSCHIGAKFPDWIQTQQELHSLYLSGVGLSGSLPAWFSDFSKGLQDLDMSSNNLTSTSLVFGFLERLARS